MSYYHKNYADSELAKQGPSIALICWEYDIAEFLAEFLCSKYLNLSFLVFHGYFALTRLHLGKIQTMVPPKFNSPNLMRQLLYAL